MVTKYKAASGKRGNIINPLISLGIIALVLVGGYYGGKAVGWWGAAPVTPAANPTTFSFLVYDASNGDELDPDNGSIFVYREDVSEFTDAEIADYEKLFANFELDDTLDIDETYTIEAGYEYVIMFNSTTYENQSILEPLAGEVVIVTAQVPTSYADLCYSDALDTTTLNTNSTASVWNFAISCLNGDSNMDVDMGLVPQFDFENDETNYFKLELGFNTTVARADVALTNLACTEELVGNNITYSFENLQVFGSQVFIVEIDEDKIGVDFDITAATLYFGDDIIAIFA